MKSATGTAETGAIQLAFTDFKEITKARLAISVVFSAVAGYLLGASEIRAVPLCSSFSGVTAW